MDTRVSMQTIYQTALAGTAQISDQLEQLQTEATTGQQYAQISDNPTATMAILGNTDQDQALTAYLGNVQTATADLNSSTAALQQVTNIFTQAKSIALQGASSANDPSTYATLADQVNQLLESLYTAANTQNNGNYVFSGTATNTQPFVATRDASGEITSVTYQGAASPASVVVDSSQEAQTYASGAQLFQGVGSAQGSGTDAFQALIDLRNDLNNTANLSSTDQVNAISNQVGTLDAANQQILNTQGSQSATLQTLNSLQSNLQNVQLSVKQNISNLGNADITNVVVQLQSYEQLLQLSYLAFQQITSTSLLNYLH